MTIEMTPGRDVPAEQLMGAAVQRSEDNRLITGDAEYVDDIQYPHMTYLSVKRSPHAHTRIESIDTSAAEAMDGVVAVYTGEDVAASGVPGTLAFTPADASPEHFMMARDKAVYLGEPVVAVVAESRYAARDGVDAVDVEYEPLDAVVDPIEAADEDAPLLHEELGTNVGLDWSTGDEDEVNAALDEADHVVDLDFTNQRVIPTAMEPRATVARYKASSNELVVEMTSQNPHDHRDNIAAALDLPQHKVRVRSPDVGGGFGAKIHHYSDETITSWCAMQLERPVKWTATRTEDFLSTAHGRNHRTSARIGVDDDGTIRGLDVDSYVGMGGYLSTEEAGIAGQLFGMMLSGQYDIPAIYAHVTGTYTNATPVDAYRGAGRPEASFAIERMVSAAAKATGIDPTEIRRTNFIDPDDFPHRVVTGFTYDSGDYEKTLDRAMELADYDGWRERQAEAREDGRYLGIGVSSYVEVCGFGPGTPEGGQVRITPAGEVLVAAGTHSHGQGHKTSYAQIVANHLGVPFDDIEVKEGDTGETPEGNGTSGSRSMAVGGSAVSESARKLREKTERIAAHKLEAAVEDIEFGDGEFSVTGAPSQSVTMKEVAAAAYAGDVPEGEEIGLDETTYYNPKNVSFPFGTQIVVVEVDPETGDIEFEEYVGVDDVGTQINPKIIEGQVHGGIVQGMGQALLEGAEYDENGQLLTGSLQDYAVPKSINSPEMELDQTVTECPHNPIGAKGVGELGTIGAAQAVVHAVVDALQPFGVETVEMPVTNETVWRAINDADGE